MKRITIEDVAKAAGVSRQTVSRAMNDKGEISPATKARVMQAVDDLGYVPNRLAQGMVTRTTRTIGLVINDVMNLFFAEAARGVQDVAQAHDYHVILSNTDNDLVTEERALHSLRAQGVDGILGFLSIPDEKLMALADVTQPVVLINRHLSHPNVGSVAVDIRGGAQRAVNYLIEQGHTKIGMIGNDNEQRTFFRRQQGYQYALANAGIELSAKWLADGPPTMNGGYHAARDLLTGAPEITAIFAYNDLMALGAIRAGREMAREIPTDLAVIGYDDIAIAALTNPALTTVRGHQYQLGQQAMYYFLQMQRTSSAQLTLQDMPHALEVELVIRESA